MTLRCVHLGAIVVPTYQRTTAEGAIMEFIHPQDLTDEQRRENSAAMHDRFANVMSRVAADPKNSKAVRAANTRDAASARSAANACRS